MLGRGEENEIASAWILKRKKKERQQMTVRTTPALAALLTEIEAISVYLLVIEIVIKDDTGEVSVVWRVSGVPRAGDVVSLLVFHVATYS